jgi:hypothetical protein
MIEFATSCWFELLDGEAVVLCCDVLIVEFESAVELADVVELAVAVVFVVA